jgi:hypothetical protein
MGSDKDSNPEAAEVSVRVTVRQYPLSSSVVLSCLVEMQLMLCGKWELSHSHWLPCGRGLQLPVIVSPAAVGARYGFRQNIVL